MARVKSRLRSTNYGTIVASLTDAASGVAAAQRVAPQIVAKMSEGMDTSAAVQAVLGVPFSLLQSRSAAAGSPGENTFARTVITLINQTTGAQLKAIKNAGHGVVKYIPGQAPTVVSPGGVTQTRSGAAAVAAGAASKLPWVIGGVAILGGAALLLKRKRK